LVWCTQISVSIESNMSMFQEPFFMLSQEGYLIKACLCASLTELRNANIGDKGRYYSGFFQLAIGIERLAKLALIIEYMVLHQLQAPGSNYVRRFSHNIDDLFLKLKNLASKRQSDTLDSFSLTELPKSILEFISSFAKRTRYANLDGLASGRAYNEPVSIWNDILFRELQINVRPKTIEKAIIERQFIADLISDFTLVRAFDLHNNQMDIEQWLTIPKLLDMASKYVVLDISQILRPMIDLTNELAWDAREINVEQDHDKCKIPELREFFWFLPNDRSYILRKKRWP